MHENTHPTVFSFDPIFTLNITELKKTAGKIACGLFFEPSEGFEPTTPRLQITCSGQLSYEGRWVSDLHRAATTFDPCCDQALGD